MTGTGKRRNASQHRCTEVIKLRALSRSSAAISPISAPPTKARSPAPVTITSRSSSSEASAAVVSMISVISARLRLFILAALSIVSRARWPPSGRFSRRTRTLIPLRPLSSSGIIGVQVILAAAAKTKQKQPSRLELLRRLVHIRLGYPEVIVDIVEDPEELREIYGAPSERSLKKQLTRFDKHCRAFIARSPFLVIASSDPSGRCDASPKGDAPGFVQVLNDETLLIPDRLGNNRVDTIGNLLAWPGVGLIFFVPGINETLRVNGRARVTTDPALLEPWRSTARRRVARSWCRPKKSISTVV